MDSLLNYHILSTSPTLPSSFPLEDIKLVGAHFMWPTTQGEDVVVAVIDTGIDVNHPEFENRIIGGRNFCLTWEYNNDPNKFQDDNGHGSWIAAKIAGKQTGIAPKAKLLILKVLQYDGYGQRDWIINALDYARTWRGPNGEKVNIINMSLSGTQYDSTYESVFNKCVQSGISIVCAAGNSGDGNSIIDEIAYPAYFKEAITVGAIDLNKKIANFPNSNKEIDVCAPGVNTWSVYLEGKYAQLYGTSMAAPVVTGMLTLIINKHKLRTGNFSIEPVAYELFKNYTNDVDVLGIDANTGAGMVSFWYDGINLKQVKERVVNFWIGQKVMEVDGQRIPLDSAPSLDVNGRNQILARTMCEHGLNGKVSWFPSEQKRVELKFLYTID